MISAKEARYCVKSSLFMREQKELEMVENLIVEASSEGLYDVMLRQPNFDFEETREELLRLGYEITYVESTIGCLGLGCSARICISWDSDEEESEETNND